MPVFIAIIAGIVALIIIIVVVIMVHLGNVADEEAATQKAKDEAVRFKKPSSSLLHRFYCNRSWGWHRARNAAWCPAES